MAGKTITSTITSLSSFLMAFLFAASASFQLNDHDWYFWLPLYSFASIVNTVNGLGKSPKIIRSLAIFALWLGLFLFIKVMFEDLQNGLSGLWSINMRKRVVREKIGSGLVIGSLSLQLKAPVAGGRKQEPLKFLEYGMAILVGVGYGLCLLFYLCHKGEMKF